MSGPPNARTSLKSGSGHESRRVTLISLAGLLALTLAIFGDLLFAGGTRVFGHPGADLFLQYYSWRDFGFRELARGNLALWNPHIFCGAPFFGGMQSALLYPPNWFFLFLPVAVAINWIMAINVFLFGAFMFSWTRVRGLGAVASFFAGGIVIFSGPYFLHLFAGHLPQMAAMTWSPLVFCAIDGFFKTRSPGWCLLGILSVALQILAGFPQYVFYTAIVAGFYSALRLIGEWNWRTAAGLLSIYPGGAAIAAVQLLPAIDATAETVRGVRVPFQFASQCPFPPENLITLLTPNFFGKIAGYWGRCYLWETSLFIGITTLALGSFAAIYLERRIKCVPLAVIFFALLLSLGVHTPLFAVLYEHVPGFDRFRVAAKFIFPASLFIVLLAATALDRMFEQERVNPKFVIGILIAACVFGVAGLGVAKTDRLPALMNTLAATHETYLLPHLYSDIEFTGQAKKTAANSLFLSAGICLILATLLALHKRNARLLFGVVVLGLAEVSWSAANARATFDSKLIVDPEVKSVLDKHPGGYRILNLINANSAMSSGTADIWGYDPEVVRRYAEFITWTQGGDPNDATLYVKFTRFDPLYSMLRLRYVFSRHDNKVDSAEAPVAPMPHLQLITSYRVMQNRETIFDALRSETFDPTREVILEKEPEPKPSPSTATDTARIVNESTDQLTIEADIAQPAILLITDVYTPNWRAVSLSGSAQSKYQLLPANYILRAVPLTAGHHHLRVEYAPCGFTIGKWISIVVSILFLGIWFWQPRAV